MSQVSENAQPAHESNQVLCRNEERSANTVQPPYLFKQYSILPFDLVPVATTMKKRTHLRPFLEISNDELSQQKYILLKSDSYQSYK